MSRRDPNAHFTWQKVEREPTVPADSIHLVHLVKRYGQANKSFAFAVVWVEVPKARKAFLTMGSNDGILAWVNDEKVHESLRSRDWALRQDRAAIRLKKGRNKLFFKLLHHGALWFFSADLEDEKGRPIPGWKAVLDPK